MRRQGLDNLASPYFFVIVLNRASLSKRSHRLTGLIVDKKFEETLFIGVRELSLDFYPSL